QRRVAGLLRERFDGVIRHAIGELRRVAKPAGMDGTALGDLSSLFIEHAFVLDHEGRWIVPNVPGKRKATLSPQFRARMEAAGHLEFSVRDIAGALAMFRGIATRSKNRTEQAIALNAAARCALKMGDEEKARQQYTALLRDHPMAFDGHGVHLATYAHLRKADMFLRNGQPHEALRTLGDWLDAIERGVYPIYEGFAYYLNRAEELVRSIADEEVTPDVKTTADALQSHLQRTKGRVRFVERYGPIIVLPDFADQLALLEAGPDSMLYRTGHTGEGPYLIVLAPASEHRFVGAHFDMKAIQTEWMGSVLAQAWNRYGFRASILEDHTAPAFKQAHKDAMTTVVELSDRAVGLQLGLYVEDPASLLKHYRQRRWLLFSIILMLTATIGFGGYLVVRDAAREVKLSRLRSDFVSNVSHELKTPLTSIRLYAETLLMKRFRGETERAHCTETILHESERLSRLVDNVLDFSRIEQGRKTYQLRNEDLADVARSCLDLFRYRLREEGFIVRTDIPASLRPIPLDRDGVTQAILNLLNNAVKYSAEKKEIHFLVCDTVDHVIVEVADQGIGIPKQEQVRIFDTFYRIESDRLKVSGAGLGLTLVRHVMDAHQGRVEVESTVGQGSAFRLVFPQGKSNVKDENRNVK
ncbi:MAG: hypothetical protein KAR36_10115, partial [Candidatus Latescibacteria bacterium]|nr:hypothetical protein [Candidatus Latescibacterota bacterium]